MTSSSQKEFIFIFQSNFFLCFLPILLQKYLHTNYFSALLQILFHGLLTDCPKDRWLVTLQVKSCSMAVDAILNPFVQMLINKIRQKSFLLEKSLLTVVTLKE